jgi:hypothetical protein
LRSKMDGWMDAKARGGYESNNPGLSCDQNELVVGKRSLAGMRAGT